MSQNKSSTYATLEDRIGHELDADLYSLALGAHLSAQVAKHLALRVEAGGVLNLADWRGEEHNLGLRTEDGGPAATDPDTDRGRRKSLEYLHLVLDAKPDSDVTTTRCVDTINSLDRRLLDESAKAKLREIPWIGGRIPDELEDVLRKSGEN